MRGSCNSSLSEGRKGSSDLIETEEIKSLGGNLAVLEVEQRS